MKKAKNIGLVSLGCPKALVDSERIISLLRAQGYLFSSNYEGADVVIVNTCGFIDSAKAESLEAIGEAIARNGKVIVTGCLGIERQLIQDLHPNVLAITGPHQYEEVVREVHKAAPPIFAPYSDLVPKSGLKLTPRHYSYLKISEGCNNRCTFCIIPNIRGNLVSRPIASVLYEAERLVESGTKELLVISQDTSAYGSDIGYAKSKFHGKEIEARFLSLCEHLGELGVWVRLHYVYPYPHIDKVLELMAAGKILPYLDVPFQHASPKVLKQMRRPANQEKTLQRIMNWRKICPDLTIRSTFIVGFPGESEEDFTFLLNWIKDAGIDRIGCFEYEPVNGAVANKFSEQIDPEIKAERFQRLMHVAKQISAQRLKNKRGKVIDVIIDDVNTKTKKALGRSIWDAPEIDGIVVIDDAEKVEIGQIVKVHIEDSDDYDLFGRLTGIKNEKT